MGLWYFPFLNGLSLHGLWIGVILTTYKSWDDPPSSAIEIWGMVSRDISTHDGQLCLIQKFDMHPHDGAFFLVNPWKFNKEILPKMVSFFGTLRDSCFASGIWAIPFFWVWIRAKRMCSEYDVWGCSILWSLTLTNWDDPPRTPNQSLIMIWIQYISFRTVVSSITLGIKKPRWTHGGFSGKNSGRIFSSSQPRHWKTNLATQHHKTSILNVL